MLVVAKFSDKCIKQPQLSIDLILFSRLESDNYDNHSLSLVPISTHCHGIYIYSNLEICLTN
jgi:hypothetical protein